MLKSIVIATRNKGKAAEFRDMLSPLGIEVLSLLDLPEGAAPDVVEDGETFAANAEKKARAAAEALGRPALADDSGLCVDELDGAPGVYSARYAGEPSDDARNNEKLLRELAAIGAEHTTADGVAALSPARFVCALALYIPEQGRTIPAEGAVEGAIVPEPRGTGGFGYDPLFYVPGLGKTFGEAAPEEKHRVSHRGKALLELAEKLKHEFGGRL
ncbi:XTP/dITP diphosphatase [Paenibacillus sp.]|uniref:XTP/dITP diphosphatase n=1 Tax=Paenibacillus sp. TaxID=58172 RepID=UPI002D2FBF4A|nr:XTP/dITP diphosphatase [Paenibacillus sp.]HZG87105.1 XTP/dITP diphosphatase [Paenibacillus sp.]